MEPDEFLGTIYFGDRACKALLLEVWKQEISIQVDRISRIRSSTGKWEFYTDEDIPDGRLVFTGVTSFKLAPAGPLPNDLINDIKVTNVSDLQSGKRIFLFVILIASVDDSGDSTEVAIEIQAEGLHLEDPARPGEVVRT